MHESCTQLTRWCVSKSMDKDWALATSLGEKLILCQVKKDIFPYCNEQNVGLVLMIFYNKGNVEEVSL